MTSSDATASLHEMVPFAGTLGIEMLSSAPSEVRGRVAWSEGLCTVGGVLNGGVIMALADNTGALCAFLNLPEGSTNTTTIESKTNFFRPVVDGYATAVSRPLHAGKRFVVVETDVLDDEERRVARVTQTQAFL